MKASQSARRSPSAPARSLLAAMSLATVGLLLCPSAHAADLYWGSTPTSGIYADNFNTPGNWFTDAAGSTVSLAAPTSADNLFFNTTPNNAIGGAVLVTSTFIDANSLNFNTTAATTIRSSNTTARTLRLGTGGITLGVDSGGATIGGGSNTIRTRVTANQTWTNNSINALTVNNTTQVLDGTSGTFSVTLNAASTGVITLATTLGNNADNSGILALVVDSAGSGIVNATAGGAFSGGTTVKRGILQASAATLGTGEIKLGDTIGSETATFRRTNTTAFTNTLNVQAGNTGTNLLEFAVVSGSNAGAWDGDVLLNNTLTVGVIATRTATINGDISGFGDFVKGQYQGGASGGLILNGANTYSGDTIINDGAFTLGDNATLTFYIGGDGLNNQVTGTGTAIFNGDFVFDLSGADTSNGNSWLIVDVGTLAESFSSTFVVQNFTETVVDSGIWTLGNYTFTESTGELTYAAVPESSTFALVGGLAALGFAVRRRRTRS